MELIIPFGPFLSASIVSSVCNVIGRSKLHCKLYIGTRQITKTKVEENLPYEQKHHTQLGYIDSLEVPK